MIRGIKFFDWLLYLIVFILVSMGVVVIFSITYYSGKESLAISQLIYAIIGLAFMITFTLLDYRTVSSASTVLYIVGVALLVVVLVLGRSELGSTRWIDLGFFRFQPSEIFKIILILALSVYLSKREKLELSGFLIYIFLVALPSILVFVEPDLGTALVYLIIGASLFLAFKAKEIYILASIFTLCLLLPIFWFFILHDYQRERILTFLDPSRDPFGSGYNVLQSTIAIGSGQLWGRGLGHGPQSQLYFLPIQHSDFIFASIAEELGFVGAAFLLILFLFLFSRILRIASVARDSLGKFICFGVLSMILFQVLVNVGMNLGIMPVTGLPLPLISHGGSSLFTTLISLGVVGSVYMRHKKIAFG